jgi:hypothetical protein
MFISLSSRFANVGDTTDTSRTRIRTGQWPDLERSFTMGSEELMETEVQQVERFFVSRLNRSSNSHLSALGNLLQSLLLDSCKTY